MPPAGYLQEMRRLCNDTGTVLIFDEVQTGVGRTGTFYGFENEGVVPDVVTLAKGLAAGVPIGAMLANEDAGLRSRLEAFRQRQTDAARAMSLPPRDPA